MMREGVRSAERCQAISHKGIVVGVMKKVNQKGGMMSVKGIKKIDAVSRKAWRRGPTGKSIVQFSPEGKPLNVFKDIHAAMEGVETRHPQLIYKALAGKAAMAYGFQWRYLVDVKIVRTTEKVKAPCKKK